MYGTYYIVGHIVYFFLVTFLVIFSVILTVTFLVILSFIFLAITLVIFLVVGGTGGTRLRASQSFMERRTVSIPSKTSLQVSCFSY